MSKIVPIKDFRKNLAHFADLAEQGVEIIVIRRSKPAFKVIPLAKDEEDVQWETLIDFTEEYPGGIPAEKLLKILQDFQKKHG